MIYCGQTPLSLSLSLSRCCRRCKRRIHQIFDHIPLSRGRLRLNYLRTLAWTVALIKFTACDYHYSGSLYFHIYR